MLLFQDNHELLKKWCAKIPRKDRSITFKDRVCEKHFLEEDLIHCWESTVEGKTVTIERDRPRLRDGAVPRIFPNCPEYLSDKGRKKRKSPKKRNTEGGFEIPDLKKT